MTQFVLPAAQILTPYQQGAFVGLCGLYSTLNAIRLAAYPVRPITGREARRLYFDGIAELRAAAQLRKVIEFGMPERLWMRLGVALTERAGDLTGLRFERCYLLRSIETDRFDIALKRIGASAERGAPTLIFARGALNHFTVVAGVSAARLHLFDSTGLKWVRAGSCGLRSRRSISRHQLCRWSAVALFCST